MQAPCIRGRLRRFDKGELIFGQDDPASGWLELVSGSVRLCHYYADGRRHVLAFYLPGDVFGFDAGYRFASAEALSDGETVWHARDDDKVAMKSRGSGGETGLPLERALRLTENSLKFFSHSTAPQRLAAFLIDFHRRQGLPGRIDLPMSRLDIAEHLGLTMHTISRTISLLCREGMIECPTPQRIVFRRRADLMRSAGIDEADFSTRAMSLVA